MPREKVIDRICQDVVRQIGGGSPPGLGVWAESWELTQGAAEAFDAACRRWAQDGHVGGYQEVRSAAAALVAAWRDAADEYQRRGSSE